MTKREASYSIDPNTLEEKQKDEEHNLQKTKIDDKNEKQQRKIFKIKRPGDSQPVQQKEAKVSFKLNESQQIKPSEDVKTNGGQKDEDKKQKPVNPFTSLFGNNGASSIFHGVGIFSNVNSTNLFTSNKGTQVSSSVNANQKLVGDTTNGGSIFSGLSKPANIFTNVKGPSIFENSTSIKNTSSSLFSQNQTHNDEDGSGDSAELEQNQKFQANPQKSEAKFQYGQTCPVLLTLKVAKFKKSGGQLVQNVEIVLQKQKQTGIKYITVRLPATKKSIFSGILIEGKSEIKHLHGKKQNVEVAAFYKDKEKFNKILLKFQFENPEDGQKLFERLEELVQAKKSEGQAAGEPKQ